MNITLINDLIDQHGESFIKCKGCSICDQIVSLRGRDKGPKEKFNLILAKGLDMTKSDISYLLNNGIQKKTIRETLEMEVDDFQEMMTNLGFRKRKSYNKVKVNLSKEEYLEFKKQGISEKDIAAKLNISYKTLWSYRQKWENSTAEEEKLWA